MQGLGQGAQIGKSSSRALGLQGMMPLLCIKRIDKDMIGLGQGAHIGKSYSRALEAPRHDLMTL